MSGYSTKSNRKGAILIETLLDLPSRLRRLARRSLVAAILMDLAVRIVAHDRTREEQKAIMAAGADAMNVRLFGEHRDQEVGR